MDAIERLSFDSVLGSSISASEHVQRYQWAAEACRGLRVLDLCCGVGYGSMLLAGSAAAVVGVDNDEGAIAEASKAAAAAEAQVEFVLGDALEWLRDNLAERFDAIVCFEGLEHLSDFDAAMTRLRGHAERGVQLLLSVPNSRTFGEQNEFHVTDLDYEGALAAFGALPGAQVLFQFVADGAVILDEAAEWNEEARITLPDRTEPEYANTFLCAAGVSETSLAAASAHMRLTLAPYQNRELRNLAHANHELWLTNRQLGRQLSELSAELDKGEVGLAGLRSLDTAAGTAVSKLVERAERAEERLTVLGKELEEARRNAEQELYEARHDAEVELYQARHDAEVELYEATQTAEAGWGRYHDLRQRGVVRLALGIQATLRSRR